jgi:hypothetical protein
MISDLAERDATQGRRAYMMMRTTAMPAATTMTTRIENSNTGTRRI